MIKYLELKSGYDHNGPAWIAKVRPSKTGKTIYFNNKALKKLKRASARGNYYDLETGEYYWISGGKKNGEDRHWAGAGVIFVEQGVVATYLEEVDFSQLLPSVHQVIPDLPLPSIERFKLLENEPQ